VTSGDTANAWISRTPLPSLPVVTLHRQTLDRHISVNHPEMLGKVALVLATLENPSIIASGNPGTNNLVFVNHEETKANGSPLVVVVNQPKAIVCTALYHRGFRTVAEERVIWRP
jgi:hypothetical protein